MLGRRCPSIERLPVKGIEETRSLSDMNYGCDQPHAGGVIEVQVGIRQIHDIHLGGEKSLVRHKANEARLPNDHAQDC